MKAWLVEIFIYNRDDEYGNISGLYRENKVFGNKNDASKYLNKFKNRVKRCGEGNDYEARNKFYYDTTVNPHPGYLYDDSKITEIDIL